MNEVRRILSNRRRRLILLMIPLLCLGLFLYEKGGGRFDTLKSSAEEYRTLLSEYEGKSTEEILDALKAQDPLEMPSAEKERLKAQATHVKDYAAYLDSVKKQAEKQKNSSLFGKNKNSFTYRNILKTEEDFGVLNGTEAVLGNDRAVESLLAFTAADYFFLAAVLLTAMSFFDEKKNGLQAVVRSSPAGRSGLGRRRCGVLLLTSLVYTVLLYGLPMLCAFMIDGTGDLSRPVQSLVSFKKCTGRYTVAGGLIRILAVRIFCGFLLGLIIWFFLSFLKQQQLAWLLMAVAFTAEYVLYRTIPAQSVFSPFRSVNIFSYIHASGLYTDYANINFVGWPVGKQTLLLFLLAVLILLLVVLNVFLQSRRYPFGGRDILGRAVRLVGRAGDALRRHLPRLAFEGYKWLILSGSVLFVIAACLLTRSLNFDSAAYYSYSRNVDRMYLKELQGPIGSETESYLKRAHDALEEFYGDRSDFEGALERVSRYIEETKALAEQEGFEAWIVDDTFLKNVLDRGAAKTLQQNGMIAMAILICCLAPLFGLEQTSGMKMLLMSASKGRQHVFRQKYFLAFLMTLLTWCIVCGRAYLRLRDVYPAELMGISSHNFALFRGLPAAVSFGGALAVYFALSFLAMLPVTHLCLYFSELTGSGEKAMAASAAVLLLPAAALSIGVGWIRPFTLLPFLAEDHLLLAQPLQRLMFAAWFALSLLLLFRTRRSWSRA